MCLIKSSLTARGVSSLISVCILSIRRFYVITHRIQPNQIYIAPLPNLLSIGVAPPDELLVGPGQVVKSGVASLMIQSLHESWPAAHVHLRICSIGQRSARFAIVPIGKHVISPDIVGIHAVRVLRHNNQLHLRIAFECV